MFYFHKTCSSVIWINKLDWDKKSVISPKQEIVQYCTTAISFFFLIEAYASLSAETLFNCVILNVLYLNEEIVHTSVSKQTFLSQNPKL